MGTSELAESSPTIRLSQSGRRVLKVVLIFFLPGLLGALWLAIDIPQHIMRRNALRHYGVEATAKIEKLAYARGSRLWVTYVFQVDGRSIRDEVTVPDILDAKQP